MTILQLEYLHCLQIQKTDCLGRVCGNAKHHNFDNQLQCVRLKDPIN